MSQPIARRLTTTALAAALVATCAWLTYLLPPQIAAEDSRASRPYDAQMHALLAGRWDIPLSETGSEAIAVDGGYAVYFGPAPALLRLPFAALVRRFPAKAGFVSLFLAAVIGFWAAVRLGEEVSGAAAGPLEIAAFGAPVLVIASRASVYHEAIAWGSAFALLAALAALRYLSAPSVARLLATAAAALLAALARSTWILSGGVLLVALAASATVRRAWRADAGVRARAARLKERLGWPDVPRPRLHATLAAGAAAAAVVALCAVSYLKFGRLDPLPPFDRHLVYREPQRFARIGGGAFHLSNLGTGLWGYLSPGTVAYGPSFPWVGPAVRVHILPGSFTDDVEHFLGLPQLMGALMVLAAAGAAARPRGPHERGAAAVAAALALAAVPLFAFIALCGRYLYDFYPALAVAAAVGLAALRTRPRRWLRAGVCALAAYNLAVGMAVAFAIQRDLGQAERRADATAFAASVDGWLRPR